MPVVSGDLMPPPCGVCRIRFSYDTVTADLYSTWHSPSTVVATFKTPTGAVAQGAGSSFLIFVQSFSYAMKPKIYKNRSGDLYPQLETCLNWFNDAWTFEWSYNASITLQGANPFQYGFPRSHITVAVSFLWFWELIAQLRDNLFKHIWFRYDWF